MFLRDPGGLLFKSFFASFCENVFSQLRDSQAAVKRVLIDRSRFMEEAKNRPARNADRF
jgi:hypothetical protein